MKRTPDQMADEISAMRKELADEIRAMTPQQRRDLRNRTKTSRELIQASISAIDSSGTIAALVGKNRKQVIDLLMANSRWEGLESELRSFLNEVTSAKLARNHQLDVIATQTFAVTKQLIRSPENAHLIPIFEEMEQIRRSDRRKKRAPKAEPEP